MKLRYLGVLLMFFLFVQHSVEQGFDFGPNHPTDRDTPPINNHNAPTVTTTENGSNNLVYVLTILARNTTSNLLHRLEAPRDRVLDYIRPAVRSEFSRNVTNFLNLIWSRVQQSNSSLIQNQLVRSSILRPINTTLARLKLITAPEDAETIYPNVEIINLEERPQERPEEFPVENLEERPEESPQDSVESSASEVVTVTPVPIVLGSEQIDKNDEVNNDELTNAKLNNAKPLGNEEPAGEQQPKVDDAKLSEKPANQPNEPLTKSRTPRFMEGYYMTPQRVRDLFDNVRRSGMQECLALAVCESHCRPHLYETYPESGLFNRLINRVEQIQDLNHPDWEYYANARRYGQQFFDGSRQACMMCHARYYCPHERAYMMNRFADLGSFR